MKLRLALAALAICVGSGFGFAAGASPIVGQGLAESDACLSGASDCTTTAAAFSLDPPLPTKTTTGSILFSPTTAIITMTVPSFTMAATGAGPITALVFTDVTYSASVDVSINEFLLFPGFTETDILQDVGFGLGSVSGTVEEIGGAGPTAFSDLTVSFSGLSCVLLNGEGQCGLHVGAFTDAADWALDVDSVDHDVVQTFNVIVPEPGTFGLVGLGLLGIAARRRR